MGRPKIPRAYLTAIAKKGGRARIRRLTAAQRRALARKAARARWRKHRPKVGMT